MRNFKLPANFFYLLFVFLVIFLLSLTGILRPVQGLMERSLVIPAKQKVYDWRRFFKRDLNDCQLTNERELAEMKVKIASLTEENLAQKKLLSAPLPSSWQFLPVKVIGVGGETLTIASGKKDGVEEGMTALLEETYLGKVSFVSQEISRIKLASFFEEKLLVKIVSNGIVAKGLLIGRGEGRMKIEQILSSENVAKGGLVTTNIAGKDLLVGEVEEVNENKGEVFKSAVVRLLYNPEKLNTIFLLKGNL